VCTPGDRRVCQCGGGKGTQVCTDSGDGFEGCLCEVEVADGGVPGIGSEPPAAGCGTCDGCCRGSTCVPLAGESGALCGRKGQECRSCTGGVCDNQTGACVLTSPGECDAATCPTGCCSPSGCVTSTDWSRCGARGSSCEACELGGTICEADGTCQNNLIADNEYFYLSIRSITVADTDANGHDWDPFLIGHTAPDPYACLSYTDTDERGTQIPRSGCLQGCTDSTSCQLSQADGLIKYCYPLNECLLCSSPKIVCDPVLFRGAALKSGTVTLSVSDYDSVTANDSIGQASLPATPGLSTSGYATGPFGRVYQVEYEILYRLP
jgi:hypothetical protein